MELNVGNLRAHAGEKVQDFLTILNTEEKVPCTLINGTGEGKTVVITAGTHGGEYPGIEAAIRLAGELTPDKIKGQLVILHPFNLPALKAKLQYLTPYDGKNLNREFPGIALGTFTQRMAYTATQEFHAQADFYMDLHGGDIHEDLEPFVIYPTVGSDEVTRISREAAACMGLKYVSGSVSTNGTFGSAALKGVPGFLSEIGGCGVWNETEVQDYIKGVKNVLRYLKVLDGKVEENQNLALLTRMVGISATTSGCWYPSVSPGNPVKSGEKVGEIRDFFGRQLKEYFAEVDGVLLYVVSSLAISEGDPIIAIGEK